MGALPDTRMQYESTFTYPAFHLSLRSLVVFRTLTRQQYGAIVALPWLIDGFYYSSGYSGPIRTSYRELELNGP